MENEIIDNAYTPEDIQKNKVMAVLAYLGILVLVPILAAKDSKFARYHSNQGLVLWLVSIVISVLSYIPYVGIVASILSIGTFILMILGIVNAAKGEVKALPIIGGITILK